MPPYKIDPETHRPYALEFRAKGMAADHSLELQRLLRTMRREPLGEKHVIVAIEPNRRWVLAQMTGDPERPLVFFPDSEFTSLDDAEWDVFKRRWRRLTGEELALDEGGR